MEIFERCVDDCGLDSRYTAYVTCQGTQPGRLSGEGHKRCGKKVSIDRAYKCLYCGYWFCADCAEKHFGKTRDEYREEMKSSGEFQGVS